MRDKVIVVQFPTASEMVDHGLEVADRPAKFIARIKVDWIWVALMTTDVDIDTASIRLFGREAEALQPPAHIESRLRGEVESLADVEVTDVRRIDLLPSAIPLKRVGSQFERGLELVDQHLAISSHPFRGASAQREAVHMLLTHPGRPQEDRDALELQKILIEELVALDREETLAKKSLRKCKTPSPPTSRIP